VSFTTLKYLSFTHSAVYTALLVAWLVPGWHSAEYVLGWGHGIGWIVMSLLSIAAVRARTIPLWLGVMVAVVGGVGPFAGSLGFVYEERRASSTSRPVQRGMV
jgi:hypothetical protein